MHAVLVSIGGFTIYSYGLMLAIAIIVGMLLAVKLGKLRGCDPYFVTNTTFWLVAVGMAGARLAFICQHLDFYLSDPVQILNLRAGGISIQGGMAAGFAAVAYCFYREKIHPLSGLDVFAAPVILGMAIGRIGCVLQGCCVGKVCHLPWAIVYPEAAHVGVLPRHPAQIYEMLMDLVLVAVLIKVYKKASFSGQTFWCSFAGYGIIRFISEIFRESQFWGPLTIAQWFALLFMVIGIFGMAGLYGKTEVVIKELPAEDNDANAKEKVQEAAGPAAAELGEGESAGSAAKSDEGEPASVSAPETAESEPSSASAATSVPDASADEHSDAAVSEKADDSEKTLNEEKQAAASEAGSGS